MKNTVSLVSALSDALPTADPANETAVILNEVYDYINSATTRDEINEFAAAAEKGLTAVGLTSAVPATGLAMRVLDQNFHQQITSLSDFAAASGSSICPPDPCVNASSRYGNGWLAWTSPIYQASSRAGAGGLEFLEGKERFGGVTVGFGRKQGVLTFGGQFQYLHGKGDYDSAKVDSDLYGFILGGRLARAGSGGDSFNPWLDFSAGYSHVSYSQDRLDIAGNWNHSSPDANVFNAAVAFGSDFRLSRWTLTPSAGIDYVHVDQEKYTEKGGALALDTDPDKYDSLRARIGIEAKADLTDRLALVARANYRYELADRKHTLRSWFNGLRDASFVTQGKYRYNRSSGNLGAGLRYRIGERVQLGADYDLWLEDRYVGHQVSLSAGVVF